MEEARLTGVGREFQRDLIEDNEYADISNRINPVGFRETLANYPAAYIVFTLFLRRTDKWGRRHTLQNEKRLLRDQLYI